MRTTLALSLLLLAGLCAGPALALDIGPRTVPVKIFGLVLPIPLTASLDMHTDAAHPAIVAGVDIEKDRAAAQGRPRRHAVPRVLARGKVDRPHRERQYVAVVECAAHGALAACLSASACADRASARRSATTLLSAALVALSAG